MQRQLHLGLGRFVGVVLVACFTAGLADAQPQESARVSGEVTTSRAEGVSPVEGVDANGAPSETRSPAGCFPPCRAGYVCVDGACASLCGDRCAANEFCSAEARCASKCNPLCESWQLCTTDGRCEAKARRDPDEAAATAVPVPEPRSAPPDEWRFGAEFLFTSRPELQIERVTSVVVDADWNWHWAQLQLEIPATELHGRVTRTAGETRTESSRWSSARLGNPATSLLWPISTSAGELWGGFGVTLPLGGNADHAPVDVRILQQRAFEATLLNRGRVDEYLFAVDRAAALGRLHYDRRSQWWALGARGELAGLFPVKDAYRGVDALLQLRLRPRLKTPFVDLGVEGNAVLELTDSRDNTQFSMRPFVELQLRPFVFGGAFVWNIDDPGRQYPWGAMVWLEASFAGAD